MGKMFLMCGLSGAGKTTFAKEFAKENGYKYLGIDDFYRKCYGDYDDPDDSFYVWIEFFKAIHKAELAGLDIVIDTNAPTYVKRKQFIDWFPTFDEHNLIYIYATPELCRANNASRNRVVPSDEMDRMVKEFQPPVDFLDVAIPSDLCWGNIQVFKNEDNNLTKVQVLQN